MKFCTGENLAQTDRIIVEAIQPKCTTEVSVEMHARAQPGVYESQWRMSTATGLFFGGSKRIFRICYLMSRIGKQGIREYG